jgi:hypothetical protein
MKLASTAKGSSALENLLAYTITKTKKIIRKSDDTNLT